jgi:enterochelin esterase-like enzyme
MKRRRLLVASVFTTLALVAFGSGAAVVVASKGSTRAQPAASAPARALTITCQSTALDGAMPAQVYLPAGYSRSARPYPVIYFLHGLPAGPSTYKENAFVAAALAGAHRRAIVVAAQGARGDGSDREYLDWDPKENWPTAISRDLTSCIDHRYRTIAGRWGRALIGLSAGGYGAFNIGLRNLQEFGAVQSWSGYFVATDPSGDHVLDLGSPQANEAATVPRGPQLQAQLAAYPAQLAFYVGLQDTRFLAMNNDYDASLRQTGIAHIFHTYPGGHSAALWQAQAPAWLGMALDYLAAGRRQHHAARH